MDIDKVKEILGKFRRVIETEHLDGSTICLLVLGSIPLLAGLITGIWPMALAGLGPWLLACFDIGKRRRERKRSAKWKGKVKEVKE